MDKKYLGPIGFTALIETIKAKFSLLGHKHDKTEIENLVEPVQASWSQTDETQLDYIKGKTHWTEDGTVEILPETSLVYSGEDVTFFLPQFLSLKVGEQYIVNYNGVEYRLTAQLYEEDAVTGVMMGNYGLVSGGVSTGEPFILVYAPDLFTITGTTGLVMALDGSEAIILSIKRDKEIVHKLDNKYLNLDWLPIKKECTILIEYQVIKSGALIDTMTSSMITAGDTIVVCYDNREYECMITAISENKDTLLAGNLSGLGVLDTGEPFTIVIGSVYTNILFNDSEKHSIAVYNPNGEGDYYYNKIPTDFIPSSFNNITYTLNKQGKSIILTGSDGSISQITDTDTDTNITYTLSRRDSSIILAGSDGSVSEVNDPEHTFPTDAVVGDLPMYDGTNWVSTSKTDLIAEIISAVLAELGGSSGDGGETAEAFTVDVLSVDNYGESPIVPIGESGVAYWVGSAVPTLEQMRGCSFSCNFGEVTLVLNNPNVEEQSDGYWIYFTTCEETTISTSFPPVFVPKADSGYETGVYVCFDACEEVYTSVTEGIESMTGGAISFPEV